MTSFPTSQEEFYNLRDDRTNRYITNRDYQTSRCVVTIDEDFADTFTGQVALLTTCNLLSRWCRNVLIMAPGIATYRSLDTSGISLGELILRQMFDADPFGNFGLGEEVKAFRPQFQIHIGPNFERLVDKSVIIGASSWYAAVSTSATIDLRPTIDENCVGAIAAACFGVSQIFKYAIGYPEDMAIADGVFDLFNLQRVELQEDKSSLWNSEAMDIGRVLMVGAGSIGSAAAYALKAIGAKMELTVADHDLVKIENFNRSPIFGKDNFQDNKAKAVAAFLQDSSIKAVAFEGSWDDFIKTAGSLKNHFDIWLPLANEEDVRWSMQNNIPPLMIHASTTQNWGVNYGRHIPGKEDCIVDRFPGDSVDSHLECSTAAVEVKDSIIDAALPFLSFFGGLLVAADLVKSRLNDYPQIPNFALIDFGGPLDQVQRFAKRAGTNCLCQITNKLQEEFNGNTTYYYLVQ